MNNQRPDIVKVFVQAHPRQVLKDFRRSKYFSIFGNILSVARQYGIEVLSTDGGIVCQAPKSRMQIFVEKLHFAKVKYREITS